MLDVVIPHRDMEAVNLRHETGIHFYTSRIIPCSNVLCGPPPSKKKPEQVRTLRIFLSTLSSLQRRPTLPLERTYATSKMAPVSTRFDVALMPEGIQRRKLEQYSVHYNAITRLWVATISRHERAEPAGISQSRTMYYKFASEIEAKKFAMAYSPPKMHPFTDACQICAVRFAAKCRPCSCRNCGACICDKCSTRWAIRMLPKTYVSQQSLTTRVCTRCDWLSNSFCITLLKGGSVQEAKTLYASGNVNLRSCFADINHEAL